MPQMLILVGLPGSGKTCFSTMLVKYIKSWERVNQDDVGSRSQCEAAASKFLKEGKNVVIDRCNFDEDQRKIWIKIAEAANCHPSGVEGKFGAEVVSRFDKIMTRPSTSEGFRFTHDILAHMASFKNGKTAHEVYCEQFIKIIITLYPPPVTVKPPAKDECKKKEECIKIEETIKVSKPKETTKIDVDIDVNIIDKKKPAPKPAPEKPACKPDQQTKISCKESGDFWSTPWADKKTFDLIKPNEGFGTYKETKAMWEDEEHTQHFNHSLFNEQAEREDRPNVKAEKRTRHLQHSDHMVSACAGVARAFDYMNLDKDNQGHEVTKDGKKKHFHDRSHYHHQHEHQEDKKTNSARTYEHKHMTNFRHIHSGDPDKARTEAFEHRSFNYAFKGGANFDPEKIMLSSSKNKLKFEDEIKASFHNLPMNDHFKFAQNIKWETDFPTKPNFSIFK
ncbi:hypothetical protein BB561_000575 [Smittium simulii]|uniref:Transcription factor n=1 Tax=Smittium simulii TaxID=133385 RepID=A0A2T9YYI6_9FUNG|nr:hypothetical protein BB561_000575 [Smittium simulii]